MRSHVPPAALKVIDEELDKLQGLEQASSEFNVTRNYLDWLTQMPWGKHTQERLEIDHAQQVRGRHAGCHSSQKASVQHACQG